MKNDPIFRFILASHTSVHFHGFYWGLVHAGYKGKISDAIEIYLNRFKFVNSDEECIKLGFTRMNDRIHEITKYR